MQQIKKFSVTHCLSMKQYLLTILFFVSIQSYSQYSIAWARTVGGNYVDNGNCAIETKDRGFVTAGYTKRDNKVAWIVKFDNKGEEIWGKTFDSIGYTEVKGIVETRDSSLVVAGCYYSRKKATSDLWVMKIDKKGKFIWSKRFGDLQYNEGAEGIAYCSDGGFGLCGFSEANDDIQMDMWIMKIDSMGNKVWDYTWGGTKPDMGLDIIQTKAKNLVIAGFTGSKGGGFRTSWVISVDSVGNYLWDEDYLYNEWDNATSLVETFDGGIAVAGFTKAVGIVNYDIRVIKIDQFGKKLWDFVYGTVEWEEATDICETYDRGLAISGFTKTVGGDYDDFWVLYLNREGELEWEDNFGGSAFDFASCILETIDKGLLLVGSTFTNEELGWDYALLKLSRDSVSDYLLPHFFVDSPKDTVVTVFEKEFMLHSCIRSKDTLYKVEVYLNDSLIIPMATLMYNSKDDSICNYKIVEKLDLREGKNTIKLKGKNYIGENFSRVFIIFCVMLLKVRW